MEVGAQWQAGGTSASATIYRNDVRNLIVFQPDRRCARPIRPTPSVAPATSGRARLQGATLTGAQRWGGLKVSAVIDLLDAKDRDSGVRLARRAAHQETLAADYDAGAWTAGASVLDIGSRPDGGIVLGGYALVDLHAAWRFMPQWRLEASLRNALDHRAEPVRDYQGLGRQAWIGIRYDGAGL